MAVKKTGLGKGLEALFCENQLTKEEEKKLKDGEEIVQSIKVIEIEPNRNQPRRNFPSESIEELAKSIERYGIIQPIIVSKKDDFYEIIAGERRWRAAQDQMKKKLADGIDGEDLNLLIGSMPIGSEIAESVKLNILNILNEKYGITEKDLLSSEIELVPAMPCRSMGFDNSMVAGYGQDDKICVYASLTALMNVQNPVKTAVCIISDKEEIGSMGNTGMESHVFDTFISEILNKLGINRPNLLEKVFCNSKMLSADVDAGLDPIYASVSEKNNASYLGRGIGLNKYTGARGKSGASDVNAEFVAEVRKIFEENDVRYQIAELGKVDIGGGGTIAYILANKGIDVIDCGVPVLSMHSPYEVTSKLDLYEAHRGYEAFWKNA